ncbi:MAG: nonstructural protein [Arizlama microvirus]|nr:MAG: nonstructural protein [Arizlama microvirus]
MVHQVLVIHDKKAEMYGMPYYIQNETDAKRALMMAMQKPDSQLFIFSEDYKLLRLGTFNDETGKFTILDIPETVIELSELSRNVINMMTRKEVQHAKV